MAASSWWDENYPGGSATFPEQITNGQGGGPPENDPTAPTSQWPAATTNTTTPAATTNSGDYRSQVEQIMGGANQMTPDKIAALKAAGFNVTPPNASGEQSKIQLPSGEWVRIIGAGEGHPVWIPQPTGSGGTDYGAMTNSGGANPGELQNYGVPQNQYSSAAYTGGYQAPTWGQSFTAPTALTEQNDPGYQARLNLGQQALERSAAAKGTILNGGTQQATNAFAQDYASNEYANVFSRAFDQYKQKYGEFSDQANLGLRAEQNQYQEYLGNNARTLNDYLTNYSIGRTGVQDLLNQQNTTADRGLRAAIASKP